MGCTRVNACYAMEECPQTALRTATSLFPKIGRMAESSPSEEAEAEVEEAAKGGVRPRARAPPPGLTFSFVV